MENLVIFCKGIPCYHKAVQDVVWKRIFNEFLMRPGVLFQEDRRDERLEKIRIPCKRRAKRITGRMDGQEESSQGRGCTLDEEAELLALRFRHESKPL
ncbi:MAG: hypothetical protein Q4D98_02670 [Planctomycetia bacterium]|nr:hypothetical protein [Planctomycetia bacterium]